MVGGINRHGYNEKSFVKLIKDLKEEWKGINCRTGVHKVFYTLRHPVLCVGCGGGGSMPIERNGSVPRKPKPGT